MLIFLHYNACLQNIPQIRRIAHQHQRPSPALQLLCTQHTQQQKDCRSQSYIGIEVEGRRKGNVDNQRGQAYYEKDIENVAADDIAYRNICIPRRAAATEVNSSGSEVPSATIVRPISAR